MSWHVNFMEEAQTDMDELDGSAKKQVDAAILKVSQNPIPKSEGGYGNPLGNKRGNNLTGLCKIKLLKLGILGYNTKEAIVKWQSYIIKDTQVSASPRRTGR